MEEKFPGAMPENAFIRQATDVLLDHCFNPSNSINLISTCRDEICRPFTQELDRLWGPSFSISSLGGMVFCWRSGFKAAMAHSPVHSGRERYIFWVMSHIALSRSSMPFLSCQPLFHTAPFITCSLAHSSLTQIMQLSLIQSCNMFSIFLSDGHENLPCSAVS